MIPALIVTLAYQDDLAAAYRPLRTLECLVTRENRLHGTRNKSRLLFQRDGKVLVDCLDQPGSQAQIAGSCLQDSPLASLLAGQKLGLSQVQLQGEEVLQGVPTRRYAAVLDGTDIRFWVSTRDGLLRRWSRLGPGEVTVWTESYSAVHIDATLTDRQFRPRATRVAVNAPPPKGRTASLPTVAATAPTESFNLGKLSLVDQASVRHDFIYYNRTDKPVRLVRAAASCGCVSTLLGAQASGGVTVEPGKSTPIQVSVSLPGLAPGPLRKSVSVYAEGQPAPVARFELEAVLQPAVAFEPPALALSTARARETTVQVFVDERLVKSGSPPNLTGPTTLLEVSSPQPSGLRLRDGVRTRAFTYRVSLRTDAPLGSQTGRLAFASPAGEAGAVWRSAGLSVSAQVEGDVSATPGAIPFGAVTGSADVEQTLALNYRGSARTGRALSADSPHVKIESVPGGVGGVERVKVRLLASCPNGVFRSAVRIRLAKGQELTVPITAYVQRPVGVGR